MKLVLILPVFNESGMIDSVLRKIEAAVKILPVRTEIVVVNDGSSDKTLAVVSRQPVTVLNHIINRGLGASLATGLAYARQQRADFAITMDGDGQHDPEDIKSVLNPLLSRRADVVVGSRTLRKNTTMPWLRRLNNKIFNWLTWLFYGIKSTDSLSGFRGFNRLALRAIKLKTERMEVSNEFFAEIAAHKLRYAEVPIKVIYTEYSLAKGVKPGAAFAIIFRLVLRFLR